MYPVSIYLNDLRLVIWDSKNWNFIYVNITPTCPEYCPNIYIAYLSKGYLTLICWKCAQSNGFAYICTAKFLRGTEAPIRTGELSAKGHLDISDIMWGVYEMNNLKLAFLTFESHMLLPQQGQTEWFPRPYMVCGQALHIPAWKKLKWFLESSLIFFFQSKKHTQKPYASH